MLDLSMSFPPPTTTMVTIIDVAKLANVSIPTEDPWASANFLIAVKLRLADNYLGLRLPYTAGSLPLAVFLFRTYFNALPAELVDAARIDGCNHLLIERHFMAGLTAGGVRG
jgi:multiple sugar transport system permease protein